jgi:hypothetical protein
MALTGGIGGLAAQPGQMLERAQRAAESLGQQAQEFESVMAAAAGQGKDAGELLAQAAQRGAEGGPPKIEGVRGPTESDGLYARAVEVAKGPEGPAKLLSEMEHGYQRLNELIGEVQGGKTYSPQQLLGMQGEMHQITLQLETASKVLSELVSGVKQLMQQQV